MDTLVQLILAAAVTVGGWLGVVTELPINQLTNADSSSVELGIVELSPRGEAGGFAIPASGSSGLPNPGPHPRVTIRACDLVPGNNGSIILSSYGMYAGYSWSGTNCTTGTKNIVAGEEVEIQWGVWNIGPPRSSPNPGDGCSATAGGGFSTGNQLAGTDESVVEPSVGNTSTFAVQCQYRGLTGTRTFSDSVNVRQLAQCEDGQDNDSDGRTDHNVVCNAYGCTVVGDRGCSSPSDNDESDDPPFAQCEDGVDNDGDGLIDHRVVCNAYGCTVVGDPECASPSDNNEDDDPTGTGGLTITADPNLLDRSDTTKIRWELDGNTGCVITSTNNDPNFGGSGGLPVIMDGELDTDQIFGEVTYTIDCTDTGASDDVEVRVRPFIEDF